MSFPARQPRPSVAALLVLALSPAASAQDAPRAVWERDAAATVAERVAPQLEGAERGSRWAQGRDPLEAGDVVRRRDRVWRVDPATGKRGALMLDVTGEAELVDLPDELLEGVALPVTLRTSMREDVLDLPHVVVLRARVRGDGCAVARAVGRGPAETRADLARGGATLPLTLTVADPDGVATVTLSSPGWGSITHTYRRTSRTAAPPPVKPAPGDEVRTPEEAPSTPRDGGVAPPELRPVGDAPRVVSPPDADAPDTTAPPAGAATTTDPAGPGTEAVTASADGGTGAPPTQEPSERVPPSAPVGPPGALERDHHRLGLDLAEDSSGGTGRLVVRAVLLGYGFPGDARVRPGDVLAEVGAVPVDGLALLDGVVRASGVPRELTVLRGGERLVVATPRPVAIPGLPSDARPADVVALAQVWATAGGPGALGADLADGLNGGAVVVGVTGAATGRLEIGDLVSAVDGARVADARDLERRLERRPAGAEVRLAVARLGRTLEIAVPLDPVHSRADVARVRVALLTGKAGGPGLRTDANVFRLPGGLAFEAPLDLFSIEPEDDELVLELRPGGAARDDAFVAVHASSEESPFDGMSLAESMDVLIGAIAESGDQVLLAPPEEREVAGREAFALRMRGQLGSDLPRDMLLHVLVIPGPGPALSVAVGYRPGLEEVWRDRLDNVIESLDTPPRDDGSESQWIDWHDRASGLSFRAPQEWVLRPEPAGELDQGRECYHLGLRGDRGVGVRLVLFSVPQAPGHGTPQQEAARFNAAVGDLPWLRGRPPAEVVQLGDREGLLFAEGESDTDEPGIVVVGASLVLPPASVGVLQLVLDDFTAGEEVSIPEALRIASTLRFEEPRR